MVTEVVGFDKVDGSVFDCFFWQETLDEVDKNNDGMISLNEYLS